MRVVAVPLTPQFALGASKSEILYDIDADVSKLEKFKTTNKVYKDWDDKYSDRVIRNTKFVFETVYLKSLNETCYNNKDYINV